MINKNYKKVPAIVLSLILSASLAACASETANSTSAETTEETQEIQETTEDTAAEGETADAENADGEMPEMPDGEMPEMPDGEKPDGEMPGEPPEGGMGGGMGGAPGSSSADIEYTSVNTYDSDTTIDSQTINSTGTDENAILVEGGTTTITNSTITRDSDDSTGGDNSSFYGVGAAVLAKSGTVKISGSEITTDSAGGAGVFAYGDGVVYISDSTIKTTQNTSGGIHAAGGGTLYAWNLNVETDGGSAAAIRSDRGGGTMVVDGGTYTSNGSGSPAVYCTADITINDADLEATGSEAICIEGLNTLRLFDTDLTGNMPDDSQNDITWNIILYQSMSGDSEVGNSTFSMKGGSVTAKNGGMFYTTNTECTFVLEDVDINYSSDNDFLLQVTGNTNQRGWGSAGANGSQCRFTAIDQELEGKIVYDSISTLDFYLTDGSVLSGYFVDDETWAGDGGDGYCNVYISSDSKWVVTDDSEIDALYNAGTIVDASGKQVSIVGEDGTVYVKGTSSVTVTVSSYSTTDKSSEADAMTSWSNYEVS
ncbi:MAG: hypothetical protein K5669_12275 [Lachnospiraceae bacterium]|nr:hypothetical protein [Lachnospiraceae bacterium]